MVSDTATTSGEGGGGGGESCGKSIHYAPLLSSFLITLLLPLILPDAVALGPIGIATAHLVWFLSVFAAFFFYSLYLRESIIAFVYNLQAGIGLIRKTFEE